ncbi:MAG TPA: response regulator [Caulobacteraceae bacterium]|jgi:CheY-like chemotaxis protein|nr:response regulator [Caulobacteraceae bacterium]
MREIMANVLVIDDDPLFREIAQEMLTQVGHVVILASDGSEVSGLPAEPVPDLAVVDMLMPERDGIETIGDLQSRWPSIKVIAVSAGGRSLEPDLLLRAAKALGADATLPKPLEREAFIELVGRLAG